MTSQNTETLPKDRVISLEELATHNTKESAWVAVRGKVYDITSYIDKHPGGSEILLYAAGRDATIIFENYHSLDDIKPMNVLKKFYIGQFYDKELPVFPEPNAFQQELKTKVAEYFMKTGYDPKYHPAMLLRYSIVFAFLFTSYYSTFYVDFVRSYPVLQYLCAAVFGFACAQMGMLQMHDASHCAFTHSPTVWKILGSFHDFVNGASFLNWNYQHTWGHHPYTNIAEADPDVYTSTRDVRRIKPSQPWLSRHMFQEIWVPFLYIVLGIKTRLQDFVIVYATKKNDNIRINPLTTEQHLIFWGGKVFFLMYRFVAPMVIAKLSWVNVLTCFMISDMVLSYWLALLFQANHVVRDVEFPLPSKDNTVETDWAVHQIETSQDYAHGSFLWTNISGSLNYQVPHHLFPQISQHYYPAIAPIIQSLCTKYGIHYRVKATFWEALMGHILHLKDMGLKKDIMSGSRGDEKVLKRVDSKKVD